MNDKQTLRIYRKYKMEIKEETWFENSERSVLMIKARTNCLELNWRKIYQMKDDTCPMCNRETETLEHFLLLCHSYDDLRAQHIFLQRPYNENTDDIISQFLLMQNVDEIERKKELLQKMWRRRGKQQKLREANTPEATA